MTLLSSILLTNACDISQAVVRGSLGMPFDAQATLTLPYTQTCATFTISDLTGGTTLIHDPDRRSDQNIPAGSSVRASGTIMLDSHGIPIAKCTNISFVAKAKLPAPIPITAAQLQSGDYDFRRVTINGLVREIFRDEIDPKWIFLSMTDGHETFYSAYCEESSPSNALTVLTGAKISATGICLAIDNGHRRMLGRYVLAPNRSAFAVTSPAPSDPFSAPILPNHDYQSPSTISSSGFRRIIGRTIAVRNETDLYIRDASGRIHRITLISGPPPSFGEWIEASGLPETDLFRVNLSNAIWRKSKGPSGVAETPTDVSATNLLSISAGKLVINPTYHGCPIRLRGTIKDIPTTESKQGIITLRCGDFSIAIDVSANRSILGTLSVGCEISVAGTCIVETGSWSPYASFPHATGITLVVREPSDITILSRPPWWTPQRLLVLISSLIIALIAVIIWNRWLNRLVSRRSRALVKEQLSLAEAELKVGERTRLAIELHDSLSQNLAAVACQVAATKSAVKVNADETMENLNTTERMLLSCRSELRRCLWDLRNDTLDEQNMTEVIRKVLAPVLGQAELQIRFNVSRARLDDSTLHSVICIIRELASNAVAHGQATRLTVAGDLDGEILAFSVNENGKGFDPGTCDGPAEGHFGLAGIRERIERLCGTFTLKSRPGKGSYTKITFRLPSNDVED